MFLLLTEFSFLLSGDELLLLILSVHVQEGLSVCLSVCHALILEITDN